MIIINPVVRLKITSVGATFCFAETIGNGRPEAVFVSYNKRRLVENAGTSKARFVWGKCPVSYFLNIGDIIVAEIGDGNKKLKAATNWAPKTVWEGVHGPAGKTAGQVFDLISKIDLGKLDPEKDGDRIVRIKDPNGKQFPRGYGSLAKLLNERTHQEIRDFAESGTVVEAQFNGRWVQVRNPFFLPATVAKIAA